MTLIIIAMIILLIVITPPGTSAKMLSVVPMLAGDNTDRH